MILEQNIYNSIRTLPLFNYIEAVENSDLRYLIVLQNYNKLPTINERIQQDLQAVYEEIKGQILDFSGVSDSYQIALRMQKDIVLNKAELILTGNIDIINRIKLQVSELNEFTHNHEQNSTSLYKQCANIEKYFGFQFDTKNTTLYRWLIYNDIFNEQLKQQQHGRQSD